MTTAIKHIEKKGPCNKWFDRQAVMRTKSLYESQFGKELPVTRRVVRNMNIKHVMWIENDDQVPIAACMLTEIYPSFYRISGLAVDFAHQRKGYGTALICEIEAVLPDRSIIELGVDTDTEKTEWLRRWYARMGYEECGHNGYEITMHKRIQRAK